MGPPWGRQKHQEGMKDADFSLGHWAWTAEKEGDLKGMRGLEATTKPLGHLLPCTRSSHHTCGSGFGAQDTLLFQCLPEPAYFLKTR